MNKRIQKMLLYKWEAASAITCTILIVLSVYLFLPFTKTAFNMFESLRKDMHELRDTGTLVSRINKASKRADYLDSLIMSSSMEDSASQTNIIGFLYENADSAKCTASKVELGEEIKTPFGHETPLLFTGQGEYSSVAKLVESVENINTGTRIRQLSLKNNKNGMVDVVMDFVVIEE